MAAPALPAGPVTPCAPGAPLAPFAPGAPPEPLAPRAPAVPFALKTSDVVCFAHFLPVLTTVSVPLDLTQPWMRPVLPTKPAMVAA